MLYITGPTASGKSAIAIQLARELGAEIISADAFQIYRGMEILSAAPTPEERRQVPHHLISCVDPAQPMDAARFKEMAEAAIKEIHARGKKALICGGSGLYIKSLTHGLSPLPAADRRMREKLERLPLPDLQKMLRQLDPAAAQWLDLQNPRRLVRAIEVCKLAGRPFSSFRNEWTQENKPVHGALILRQRADLHERIRMRAQQMFERGVLEEVAALGELSLSAKKAIGLAEIRAVLRGEMSREDAIERIIVTTRQYSRRQLTWFKRESIFKPLNIAPSCTSAEAARAALEEFRLA